MKEGVLMQGITGTIIKLRDFLFNISTNINIKHNGESCPVMWFKKDRVMFVRDYQRDSFCSYE